MTVATLLALAMEAAERRAAAKNLICMMIGERGFISGLYVAWDFIGRGNELRKG